MLADTTLPRDPRPYARRSRRRGAHTSPPTHQQPPLMRHATRHTSKAQAGVGGLSSATCAHLWAPYGASKTPACQTAATRTSRELRTPPHVAGRPAGSRRRTRRPSAMCEGRRRGATPCSRLIALRRLGSARGFINRLAHRNARSSVSGGARGNSGHECTDRIGIDVHKRRQASCVTRVVNDGQPRAPGNATRGRGDHVLAEANISKRRGDRGRCRSRTQRRARPRAGRFARRRPRNIGTAS